MVNTNSSIRKRPRDESYYSESKLSKPKIRPSDVSEMKFSNISRDNREKRERDISLIPHTIETGHSFSHRGLVFYVAYQLSVHNNHSSS